MCISICGWCTREMLQCFCQHHRSCSRLIGLGCAWNQKHCGRMQLVGVRLTVLLKVSLFSFPHPKVQASSHRAVQGHT